MKTFNTYYEDQSGFAEFVKSNHAVFFSEENTAILVQIFCSRNEFNYIKQMISVILAELPFAFIVGATTFGEIMNGEVSGLKTVVSISVFQNTVIRGNSFPKKDEDEFELGRKIVSTLVSDKTKVLILFGAGKTVKANLVLKGIETANHNVLVAGGNAGNNNTMNLAFVIYNEVILDSGFVGVVLESDNLDVRLYSHLGWQVIGKEMTITKVQDNRVYTINSLPAFQVYRRYLGIDKHNFSNAVEFPLIINRNGLLLARTPRDYYEDESIGFFGDIEESEKVRLSFGSPDLISEKIKQLSDEIEKHAVESIFIYSCESRRGFLQDLSDVETKPLQRLAPLAGFFTTGEYYHSLGKNQLLNATMTVLVLAENNSDTNSNEFVIQESIRRPTCMDSVAERGTGMLKALTHLINTVAAELEAVNQDLNYIGLHDSLTGAYNRTFFDQEMKRLDKSNDSIGIIVCDMGCLKLVNDTLGHEFGDRMIRLLANIMMESCRKNDVVVRIGGDEFAILIVGACEKDVVGISDRIVAGAQKARVLDNLLYLSVGFAYRGKSNTLSLNEVFTAADNAMYQYKLRNKEQVRKNIMQSFAQMNRRAVDIRN